ncbi:PstS family phosphate ABC transporter substrate-binding protein [Roseateles saccharophilus]|uniref:Phosphate transport system substrate-binding protein n=1 Tax=Roseateles saccharophilus TaxID=304 RepID=A0A4R3UPS0_ROSSA|nr:substrate-binding domain-containing protein [Roseateles saccharophilus]TCU92660.1 phosphate transport system substrate-binding protein [Roseateles saccharophilus]
MHGRRRLLVAALALLAGGPGVAAEPAPYLNADGAVRIVGYNDMQDMLAAITALFQRAHPEARFELVLKGTRTAPQALARGISLFAPMGAEFSAAELADYARLTGGGVPLPFRVAHDSLNPAALSAPLGVFVDARNPVASLSLAQLARVFSGEVTSWGPLGLAGEWAKRPIHLCGMAPVTALGALMLRRLGLASFAPGLRGFVQSRDAVACVAADPLALGFGSLNRGVPGVRPVPLSTQDGGPAFAGTPEDIVSGRYPLDRHLLIYLRTDPATRRVDPLARELLRLLLSSEGQQLIADGALGYLPLNAQERAEELRRLSTLD